MHMPREYSRRERRVTFFFTFLVPVRKVAFADGKAWKRGSVLEGSDTEAIDASRALIHALAAFLWENSG